MIQKRNVLNSSRLLELKKHRRKNVRIKILFFILGVLVIFGFLVYLSHLSSLNINNVEITGNQILNTDDLKGVIEQQLAGKYLWLFPKTNIFFYPENAIKNKLLDNFKRIKDLNLSVKNNKTLEVSLTERKALYTWCGDTPLKVPDVGLPQSGIPTSGTTTNCYFMDEDGYIFDQAPYFSGEVYFKFYGSPDVSDVGILQGRSPTSETNPSGSYYSQQNFKQLIAFKNILVGFGIKPISIYKPDAGEFDVFLSNGNSSVAGPEIKISADSDFENVAENLEAALTTEPLQSEFKNKYSSLRYIDLRFGNKVYYKFQ